MFELGFQVIRTMMATMNQTLRQDTNKSGRVASVFLSWVYFKLNVYDILHDVWQDCMLRLGWVFLILSIEELTIQGLDYVCL